MEAYLILKGTAMVIGAAATFVTAVAAVWPWKTGKAARALDRVPLVAPGSLYRLLSTKPMTGNNGNGNGRSGK
jgi:hypothetical protein